MTTTSADATTTTTPPTAAPHQLGDDAISRASSPQLSEHLVAPAERTIWGLDPLQLHTRYWAAHGVQVVRQGEPSQIVSHAELFLLTDPRSLVLFHLAPLMEVLNWVQPAVLFLRLHDTRERNYQERVLTDDDGRFIRFQRLYEGSDPRLARVVLSPEREIAQLWQSAPDPLTGWRRMRRFIPRTDRITKSIDGNVFDRSADREMAAFLQDLVQVWKRPDSTIVRARRADDGVWVDPKATVDDGAQLIGNVWVGAGRHIDKGTTVIGPAVVWDDPLARPEIEAIHWLQIEPTEPPVDGAYSAQRPQIATFSRVMKRLFDLVVSFVALVCSLPLYPLIMLAIWIEDGGPFFFGHTRETMGGREFKCWKFRSMRKDAEKIKEELKKLNQADGPQFYIENDPRLTRVGKFLRSCNLDEIPQFWNVLTGDMSVVGPRPSPYSENQFCPPWREARLSVRPGITGLWQVRRTRQRGADFQEWIKYDLEYVENWSFRRDLNIIWRTITTILRKVSR